MDRFFHPNSIVVIGVSPKESNMARFIVHNCRKWGFAGQLYAVGPRGGTVDDVPIQPDLDAIPDGVDLAVILTPARVIPGILETCGRKGITRIVIESGGFGEYSPDALELEEECLAVARRYGIRFVGPNGIGIVYAKNGVVLPFSPFDDPLPDGDVSILSQSGGVGIHLILETVTHGQGLSKLVSLGNKLDLDETDFVEYLLADPETRVIVLYLEGLSKARRLMELASRADKPIVVLKSSVGRLGAQAAQSHTKALSSDDAVVDAALRQAGMIRVKETAQLTNAVKAMRLPPMQGNRVAVVSRSGGHAILVADALERDGFDLPDYSDPVLEVTRNALRADVIRLRNPLDVGDIFDFDAYLGILEAILSAGEHDGILFLHTYRVEPQRVMARRMMEGIERLAWQYHKPIACCLITLPEELDALRSRSSFPIFEQPEQAAHALALSRDHWTRRRSPFHAPPAASAPCLSVDLPGLEWVRNKMGWLPHVDSLRVLESLSVPVPGWGLATSADEAVRLGEHLGGTVVLKALSPHLLHKTEAGAIALDLRGADAIRDGYRRLVDRVRERVPQAELEGILVQQEAPEGLEVIVGGRRDLTFGPIVVFGLGGVLAELFGDVSIRVAPVDRATAREMMTQTRGARLLTGYRGRPPVDLTALEDIILAVSELLVRNPRILEIDLNPVRVYSASEGAQALDVRILAGE